MFQVEFTPSPRILRGLDEIATYLRIHRRTAWRWIQDQALPAAQTPAGTYITSTSLIDLWILAQHNLRWQQWTGESGEPADATSWADEGSPQHGVPA